MGDPRADWFQGHFNRFFDDAMLAVAGGQFGDVPVGSAGGGYGHHMHILPADEALKLANPRRTTAANTDGFPLPRAVIADPGQFRVGQPGNGFHMPGGDHACADDGNSMNGQCAGSLSGSDFFAGI